MIVGVYLYSRQTQSASSDRVNRPVAIVTLSTQEVFKIELYPEEAPNTVNNFIYLAESGFYNNIKINRIIPGYLIQGGDPIGNGKGFPGYFIKSECRYNGTKNTLSHQAGTVSMARSESFNTEGSQFFVLLEDNKDLNGQYSSFGKVVEGLDVLEGIGQRGVNVDYTPVEDLRIQSIEIETFGQEYSDPMVLSVREVLAQDE